MSSAPPVDVGKKDRGEGIEVTLVTSTASYLDWCAVHKHVAIANLVPPQPREEVLTGRNIFRDLDVILLQAVGFVCIRP